jgi:hypothetical protein
MYDGLCQHALVAYKFTGKERDAESGLDMFGARYYGSSLGRRVPTHSRSLRMSGFVMSGEEFLMAGGPL